MHPSEQNVTNPKFAHSIVSSPPSGSLRAAFFLLLFIFTVFNLYTTSQADHDGFEETVTINDAESGSLLIETNHAGQYYIAPTIDTDVQMDITGLIARVNITQHFTNPSAEWVNGIYVFPLPENAAVDHMEYDHW